MLSTIHGLESDLIGNRYGLLLVVSRLPRPNRRNSERKVSLRVLCKCDCGNVIEALKGGLVDGSKTNCGWSCGLRDKLFPKSDKRKQVFRNLRTECKRKNREFALTFEQFALLTSKNCCYCGAEPVKDFYGNVRNGIDRQNNDIGYIFSNCVSCCYTCNRMKGDLSYQGFVERCRAISNNSEDLNGSQENVTKSNVY